MSKRKEIMQSNRSDETEALNCVLLQGEIESILIKLEKTYQRNLNIFGSNQNNIDSINIDEATHHFLNS